jgi:hypothetical protein
MNNKDQKYTVLEEVTGILAVISIVLLAISVFRLFFAYLDGQIFTNTNSIIVNVKSMHRLTYTLECIMLILMYFVVLFGTGKYKLRGIIIISVIFISLITSLYVKSKSNEEFNKTFNSLKNSREKIIRDRFGFLLNSQYNDTKEDVIKRVEKKGWAVATTAFDSISTQSKKLKGQYYVIEDAHDIIKCPRSIPPINSVRYLVFFHTMRRSSSDYVEVRTQTGIPGSQETPVTVTLSTMDVYVFDNIEHRLIMYMTLLSGPETDSITDANPISGEFEKFIKENFIL